MEEIWKDIKGYEGIYQVSNLGNVRSLDRCVNCGIKNNSNVIRKGKLIKQNQNLHNYLQVHLSKKNKAKMITVHRLVAEAFLPNPNNLPQINHIDGDKLNNNVNNLEWCTAKENINHSWGLGLSKPYYFPKGYLTEYSKNLCKKVEQYDLEGNLLNTFSSISDASRKTTCSISEICKCCRDKSHSTHNFLWRYANE